MGYMRFVKLAAKFNNYKLNYRPGVLSVICVSHCSNENDMLGQAASKQSMRCAFSVCANSRVTIESSRV